MQEVVLFFLEVLRPFNFIVAQIAYMTDPLFGGTSHFLKDLGQVLEDPIEVNSLMANLDHQEVDHG